MVDWTLTAALNSYKGVRTFVTGHTGFKGSWLCAWLQSIGSDVTGYSLDPPSSPAHHSLLSPIFRCIHDNVCNLDKLLRAFREAKPSIVFHLAAQSLVRPSYNTPVATFASNVMGTVNLLEACRQTPDVRAVIIITSDKCYENREWPWSYRENDPMGGHDPYSCSKGCAELVTASYRRSFFGTATYGQEHHTLIATARSGNVIGGGDWATDRVFPDLMRAAVSRRPVLIRNPGAVRPWQHVLDPLAGYLMLGARLLQGYKDFARAWNFAPAPDACVPVSDLVQLAATHWPDIQFSFGSDTGPHEAGLLLLDATLARRVLGWTPAWDLETAVAKSVEWYRYYHEHGELLTMSNIQHYVETAGGRA